MLVFTTPPAAAPAPVGPMSPLHAAWPGAPRRPVPLPQWGHLVLVCPLNGTALSCAGTSVAADRYVLLAPAAPGFFTLATQGPDRGAPRGLVLWLSPAFILDMARFLGIPADLPALLHGVPLWQGDPVSALAAQLAAACRPPIQQETAADLLLEIVGEVLQLMRLRHQALQRLAHHRRGTVADLVPRLLRARQFVAASYARPLRTRDVAEQVALSEFHFARLFTAAFDITLRQYLIRLRLDAARRLLAAPDNTVTETALQVGYGSLSSFIHAFARQFGMTPGQYRAREISAQDLTSPPDAAPV